jgi:hypothetical protein
MANENLSQLAWHYTTGDIFKIIVENGLLLPTGVGISRNEKPILWFSIAEFWEPTASKMMMQDGQMLDMGMQGTYQHGGGLARFGIPTSKLVPWPQLARKANIPSRVKVGLETVARRNGAKPTDWFGLIAEPLPVYDVEAVEIYDGKTWVRINQHATAKAGK